MNVPNTQKSIIAVTMGDAAGIGPEVIVKAMESLQVKDICRPVIVGSSSVIIETAHRLGADMQFTRVATIGELDFHGESIPILDCCNNIIDAFKIGIESAATGQAAARAIKTAVSLALEKKVEAIVTAPTSKHALHISGYQYPGQTEFIAELTGTSDVVMMLVSQHMRVALVTTHYSLSAVADQITTDEIIKKLTILHQSLRTYFGIDSPRLAVCALNPHAGDSGIFGREEIDIIEPAIKEARAKGMDAVGPFPADTLFVRSQNKPYDAYLAMYHDQGLIPVKMDAAGSGVNVTLGLPIIRTSPDHGTAFDIAGQNLADPASMIEAVRLAARMAKMKLGVRP